MQEHWEEKGVWEIQQNACVHMCSYWTCVQLHFAWNICWGITAQYLGTERYIGFLLLMLFV